MTCVFHIASRVSDVERVHNGDNGLMFVNDKLGQAVVRSYIQFLCPVLVTNSIQQLSTV